MVSVLHYKQEKLLLSHQPQGCVSLRSAAVEYTPRFARSLHIAADRWWKFGHPKDVVPTYL